MSAKKSVRQSTTRATSPRKSTRKKKAVRKSAKRSSAKTTARKQKPAKATRKQVARKKTTASTARRTTTAAQRKMTSLGRPRVAGTVELERMFQKDLEAREVFAFLGVRTLKELETLAADEILERLTAPMVQTVGRIRKALAMNNRCLAGDHKFAVAFKKQLP